MHSEIKLENPPAFPPHPQTCAMDGLGMSLLDYFAGQALAGVLASPSLTQPSSFTAVAKDCYRFADAMLKARSNAD